MHHFNILSNFIQSPKRLSACRLGGNLQGISQASREVERKENDQRHARIGGHVKKTHEDTHTHSCLTSPPRTRHYILTAVSDTPQCLATLHPGTANDKTTVYHHHYQHHHCPSSPQHYHNAPLTHRNSRLTYHNTQHNNPTSTTIIKSLIQAS